MITVKIYEDSPNRVIDIVQALRAQGYVQGKDFDFSYRPAVYNNDGYEQVSPKHTEFKFYTEKLATLFALKYAT